MGVGAFLALAIPESLFLRPKQAIPGISASAPTERLFEVGQDLVCHFREVRPRGILAIRTASPGTASPDDPIGGALVYGRDRKKRPPVPVDRREKPGHEGDGIRRSP